MELNPSFHLESVVKDKNDLVDFEGPLSLILLLLQKDKIEIRDIRISDILDQYLAFLNEMERMDLEVTSEFVQMASYLLLIKTHELLITDDEPSELEILMESLEALKAKDALAAVKQVGPNLLEAYKTGALFFSRPPEPLPRSAGEYRYSIDPLNLLQALCSVYLNTRERPVDRNLIESAMPHRITFSIRSKSTQIIRRLRQKDLSLSELYAECSSKSELVATFVSVLELCSHGSIAITPSPDGAGYRLSFTGGDIDEIIEKIERDYE